ncbi:MAG: HAD family hydrolase [Blastocatellia bacterium]
MSIKAISFDFWNTLFAEQPGGYAYYSSRRHSLISTAIASFGEFSDDQIARACHDEAAIHYRLWSEEHRTPGAGARLDRILAKLGVRLGEKNRAALTTAIEEGVLERPPVLIQGAEDLVRQLSGKYPLGIISDTGFSPGRVLRQVLDQNDLFGAFESFVFSDEAGRSKPHLRVFEQTSRKLKAAPGQMIHIGDLEPTDVAGAKNAGYFAIRFTGVTPMNDGEQTAADRVITRLSELSGVLDEL